MYQLATINIKQLPAVKIRNQQKILELTGSKLDLITAYEVIKKETKNFTEKNDKAQQADALYSELLKMNGIAVENTEGSEKIRVKEQERARAIALMELELSLV
jgi:hypothetical protein